VSVRNEVSAGGVVYRRGPDGIEVALAARRTQKGELVWGLPKGQIEQGESPEAAAIREAQEETGIESVPEGSLGRTRYFYVWEGERVRKLVHMFLLRATGGDISEHDDEMEDVQWFALDAAEAQAAYRGERAVLRRAVEALT
jgi:8-oxo-dGTP pyrophosphatase MutT (NUDIX family)